jgi:hypothetical protein
MVSSKPTVLDACVRTALTPCFSHCFQSNYVSLLHNCAEPSNSPILFFFRTTCKEHVSHLTSALSRTAISIHLTVPSILMHYHFVLMVEPARSTCPRHCSPSAVHYLTEDLYALIYGSPFLFALHFYVPCQLAISHSFILVTGHFRGFLCRAFSVLV